MWKTPKCEKLSKCEKTTKIEKTNQVVWDAIWIARNPEKKFWTAEIEIYPLMTSNGPSGYRKNVKMVSMFFDFGPPWRRHVVNSKIFDVLRAGMALKAQISSSKIYFSSKFCQKHFFWNFDIFSIFWFFAFCHFSNFHVFVKFRCPKILLPRPNALNPKSNIGAKA